MEAGPKEKSRWIPPSKADLPVGPGSMFQPSTTIRTVYLLTRGKHTNIYPSPLPASIAGTPPLLKLSWTSHPSYVSPRVCYPPGSEDLPPLLQVVALGEDGVEVQETSLAFLGKGKGKARAEEPVRAMTDLGGPTGFLCDGGHWHRLYHETGLTRSYSVASDISGTSFQSMDTDEAASKMSNERGIYGWCSKGLSDWRIFWVGGSGNDMEDDDFEDADDVL